MSVDQAIERALFTRLENATMSPALPISYPGVGFEPPTDGSPWLRATLMKGDPLSLSVNFSGSSKYVGLLQVDLFAPPQTSLLTMTATIGPVVTAFKRGTQMEQDGFVIKINDAPSVGDLVNEKPSGSVTLTRWLMLPVRVRWLCLASNPA